MKVITNPSVLTPSQIGLLAQYIKENIEKFGLKPKGYEWEKELRKKIDSDVDLPDYNSVGDMQDNLVNYFLGNMMEVES